MRSRSEKRERDWLDKVNWELGGMPGSHQRKLKDDGDGER